MENETEGDKPIRKPTIIARNRVRRAQRVKPIGDVRLDDETKETVLEMVRDGAMITELCERGILPAYHYLWREMERDPVFAAKYEDAKAKGAEMLLQSASELASEAIETGDIDQIRAAESFTRITQIYVEKIAPKKFGQLVKLGSDPDAPLTLQVINYAMPVIALNAEEERRAIGADGETSHAQAPNEYEDATFEPCTEESGQIARAQMASRSANASD